jgi:hypothetical protein
LPLTSKLLACGLLSLGLLAQNAARSAQQEEAEIRANPTYSGAFLLHQGPEDMLNDAESELDRSRFSEEPDFSRFVRLPQVAKLALEAGHNDKARAYAEEALQYVESHAKIPRSSKGNAVFYGNLVLGRLALLNDDVLQAENYLLAAGTTTGSPVLNTFGPNMSLARELLKRFRSETVLIYFEECKQFWQTGNDKGLLNRWSSDVQAGRMPVFGGNLYN